MPDCVDRGIPGPAACGADRAEIYAPDPPWTTVPNNVAFVVDTADAICTPDRCPAR